LSSTTGRPGHALCNQEYFFYDLPACIIPRYDRLHWQEVTKATQDECNEWYQTVHRRVI
jgi:hypothetical protein